MGCRRILLESCCGVRGFLDAKKDGLLFSLVAGVSGSRGFGTASWRRLFRARKAGCKRALIRV